MTKVFIEEEYRAFPVPLHDDLLDSLSRIAEPEIPLVWPRERGDSMFSRAIGRVNTNVKIF